VNATASRKCHNRKKFGAEPFSRELYINAVKLLLVLTEECNFQMNTPFLARPLHFFMQVH
jgi:hypothetical protein